jgi:N-dimethylarginine dimethylaminohydrolase
MWEALGFQRPIDPVSASSQHRALVDALESAGCEVLRLANIGSLTMDAVYVHDPSLIANDGAIVFHMGKPERRDEAGAHLHFYRSEGIPVLASPAPPASAEGGDMVWLDTRTLLVGRGYRTNAAGITALRDVLGPLGVDVVSAPLPHGPGPSTCLHLMSLMSMLDESTILVDREWLAVETVELFLERGFRLIDIVPGERGALACNVLSLGSGRLLALEENAATNRRLREHGFDVRTFPGAEIALNGGGGPTCLTRPVQRG